MAAPIDKQVGMFIDDQSKLKDICELLLACGCCGRCILRILGNKDPASFRCTQQEILKKLSLSIDQTTNFQNANDSSAADNITKNTCPTCLGILEDFLDLKFMETIKEQVQSLQYEYSSFICSLTVPVCILLRERAIFILLREKFRDIYEQRNEGEIASIKDVWKWRGGPLLSNILLAPFDPKSSFDIILTFALEVNKRECSVLETFQPDTFRRRKNVKGQGDFYNKVNVTKVLKSMTDEDFKSVYQVPPVPSDIKCTCAEIKCVQGSIYIAGRYNKYSRMLSQTPWFIDGQKKMEFSVEEHICPVLEKHFQYEDHKFSSSGREDVDVLMLGTGRPFCVEMINAHRIKFTQGQVTSMQKEINENTKDVQVRDLQLIDRDDVSKLKEGENEKTKCYSALCWCASPLSNDVVNQINGLQNVLLYQKTPIRVLHRRSLATRERYVYSIKATIKDEHHFSLDLKTQAGTYIKEFVHGDFGRTKPNMNTLTGTECDILQLDVTSVELEWPKSIIDVVVEEHEKKES